MGTKVCNACKYLMNDGSDFCEKCGSKYEPILSEVKGSPSKHTCNSCQKEVSADASFCPHCGIKNPLLGSGASLGQQIISPPVEENAAGNAILKYLVIGFVIVVVAMLYLLSTNKDSGTSNPKIKQPPPSSINLKLNSYQKLSGGSWRNYLDIQVLNQNLTVQKVTVNRGGCQILNQSFGINSDGPLKYGDTLTYFIMPYPACNVAEVEVITNLGAMTYNFN